MKRSTFLTSIFAIPTAIKSLAKKDDPIEPVKEVDKDSDTYFYFGGEKVAVVTSKDLQLKCPFYMDSHGNMHIEGNLKADSLND